MTVIFDTLQEPSGAPICRYPVAITLAVPSFDHSEKVTFLKTFYVYTGDTDSEMPGYYSVDLDPNSALDPDGTFYILGYPDSLKLTIVVPTSGTDQWVRDLLVSVPAVPSPIVAGLPIPEATPVLGQFPVVTQVDPLETGWETQPDLTGFATTAALASEAATRASADTTNANAIATEVTNRGTAVTAEATARANADALLIPLAQKGAAGGVAPLNSGGIIARGFLPNVSGAFYQQVANQAAMLALTGPDADTMLVVFRTDVPGVQWILNPGLAAGVLGNWAQEPFDGAGAAAAVQANLNTEATTRGNADTALTTAIGNETSRAEGVESGLSSSISTLNGEVAALPGTYGPRQTVGAVVTS